MNMKLCELGNSMQVLRDRLGEINLNSLRGTRQFYDLMELVSIMKHMVEMMNAIRMAAYSEEDKKSTHYFMTEMTQKEFEEFTADMQAKHYKFNMIKEPSLLHTQTDTNS